ncbi:hypothetical protein PAXRUDRAFT_821492 [Paxillus rubicundulus Ve08.2h10]|uniref:ER membrane protein complex subunit 10 n=1 Tax=Paxillus rubicundulus Ve08.2h10 TaxID=930991 RepID=A0A0D0DY31_9AGAM|nr:hypothetical protein PAXRUDRAFT_821492 [Paxillus rubicundulus Ve08.2h10]
MQFCLGSLLQLILPFLFIPSTFAQSSTQNESEPLRIQHRIVHPNLPITPWSELGTVALPPSGLYIISPLGAPATFIPSGSLLDDLVDFVEMIDPAMEGAMYQVALERPGTPDGLWPVSVVKACHVPGSTSSSLNIHFSASGTPFALDYFVSPVPHDGACPSPSEKRDSYPAHNATVKLTSPRQPPLPVLRTPPPLTPQGEPIAPVPEKSFVQKYWVYMAIVLGALLISGPADEPAASGGGAKRGT